MEKVVMFLDTETTGVVDMRTPYDNLEDWPHIVQLSYALIQINFNKDGASLVKTLKKVNTYVNPGDVPFDAEAVSITGISKELVQSQGNSPSEVYPEFVQDFLSCSLVVAYNHVFDMKMLKAELLRLKIDQHLRVKPWVDPMFHGTQICKIPGKRGYKWPKLEELFNKVSDSAKYNISFHNSWDDVRALYRVFMDISNNSAYDLYNEKHIQNILIKQEEKIKELYV